MDCPRTQSELDAYLDGELSAIESTVFESHMQNCPACQSVRDRNLQLRDAIRDRSMYYRAPAALVDRIDAAIGGATPNSKPLTRRAWPAWGLGLTAMAACLAIALAMFKARAATDDLLASEIVSGHIRSMMASHLLDVPSSDRHTVKPWFDGKLDFAPPVRDTSAQGFPLIGGRIDYLVDRPVAALIFKRQQHIINLYIWPTGTAADADRVLTRQGYNLVHWTQAGMTFWAVSDLELTQLQQFAEAQQASG